MCANEYTIHPVRCPHLTEIGLQVFALFQANAIILMDSLQAVRWGHLTGWYERIKLDIWL